MTGYEAVMDRGLFKAFGIDVAAGNGEPVQILPAGPA
jgi:hypothetical protein